MIDKIEGAGPNQVRRIDHTNTQAAKASDANVEQVEQSNAVNSQSESLTIARAQAQIEATPEMDRAKVERIKTAIAEGNYHIDSERVAKAFTDLEQLING